MRALSREATEKEREKALPPISHISGLAGALTYFIVRLRSRKKKRRIARQRRSLPHSSALSLSLFASLYRAVSPSFFFPSGVAEDHLWRSLYAKDASAKIILFFSNGKTTFTPRVPARCAHTSIITRILMKITFRSIRHPPSAFPIVPFYLDRLFFSLAFFFFTSPNRCGRLSLFHMIPCRFVASTRIDFGAQKSKSRPPRL